MDIAKIIAEELNVRIGQVQSAMELMDSGCTVPFIARYRKEATGGLTDESLRDLETRLEYLRSLEERKATVLASMEEQGVLTPELTKAVEEAMTLVALEDIYRPYKPKRRTRATIAREQGLEPLANIILLQMIDTREGSLLKEAGKYVDPEKGIASPEEAMAGARDIIAENISDNAEFRAYIRDITRREGTLYSKAKDPETETVYLQYYDYREPLAKAAGHRILAMNRGEKEKVLTVKVESPEEDIIRYLSEKNIIRNNPETTPQLELAVKDSYDRLIAPSIERELRTELTEMAEEGAINVFGANLDQLLMQPPIARHTVLGWDPAFRTGCKLAVVDRSGKVLDTAVIYPTPPQEKKAEAAEVLKRMIEKNDVTLISLGNGTASRESELFIAEFIKELKKETGRELSYCVVNEAGASVYSASKLASQEFPQYDVGIRSAASMARRLQDPLAELVKIDPKAIGVGQYQHDMDQKRLASSLEAVVEDCVNRVGVDLDTASPSLLSYVSGLSSTVAKNIVAWREENGSFPNRNALLKVKGLGPKGYQQCAGFLRIRGGDEPFDNTGIHPESYGIAELLLKKLGYSKEDAGAGRCRRISGETGDVKKLAAELGCGEPTLADIIKELEKPGRDPREGLPPPVLRSDVLEMEDLTEGMILKGTVRNITDFGAFVDIGVHQDGLVHISQLADRFVKHPLDVVKVGDIVEVKVLGVDISKKRISLTMRKE